MDFSTIIKDKRIIEALDTLNFKELTPIQEKVIPIIHEKKDCVIQSKTGSGKTAAFALPIIEDIEINQRDPQALILAPTRELALQIKDTFDQLGVYKKIKTLAIFGKQPFKFQKEDLKQRCHIVIGTPGRILDHLEQQTLNVDQIKYLILDEADEMLNLNFLEDIRKIVDQLPQKRTTCLFSATIDTSIRTLGTKLLKNPVWLHNENDNEVNIEQTFYEVKKSDKIRAVCQILEKEIPESCMIFANTREEVDEIEEQLSSLSISVDKIHGGMMQEERLEHMKKFKYSKFRILVSTDVAARGIDVHKVDLIINYNVPNTYKIYTHRIGRTGRMNEIGKSITLICDEERLKYEEIKAALKLEFPLSTLELKEKLDLSRLDKPKRKIKDVNHELRKDIMKIYFNGGKNKKIRPGDLVGAIISIPGVEFDDIGVIQVQDHQSYVDILNGKGELVLRSLQQKTIKNKKLRIEKAKI